MRIIFLCGRLTLTKSVIDFTLSLITGHVCFLLSETPSFPHSAVLRLVLNTRCAEQCDQKPRDWKYEFTCVFCNCCVFLRSCDSWEAGEEIPRSCRNVKPRITLLDRYLGQFNPVHTLTHDFFFPTSMCDLGSQVTRVFRFHHPVSATILLVKMDFQPL
jgi:hypothetical protein